MRYFLRYNQLRNLATRLKDDFSPKDGLLGADNSAVVNLEASAYGRDDDRF